MKPVEQTVHQPPKGNCFAACVASILEEPLDAMPAVPGYDEGEDGQPWYDAWNGWLAPRNLFLQSYYAGRDVPSPPGYAILDAKSNRGDWYHAVVCKDGEVAWDPSPYRSDGVGAPRAWFVFLVIDPTRDHQPRDGAAL